MQNKLNIFFVSFLCLIFAQKSNAQVIGNIDENGAATLTFSSSTLLDRWNEMLNNSGVKASLTSVSITRSGSEYILVARGAAYRSAALLTLSPSNQLTLQVVNGNKTVCTTKVCAGSDGCMPKKDGYCSGCEKDKKGCVKTSTNAEDLF